jgi:hypothetical protein
MAMPINDWSYLEPGNFHHFHQQWISALTDSLNGGLLPPDYLALAEQVTGRPIPDASLGGVPEPPQGPHQAGEELIRSALIYLHTD